MNNVIGIFHWMVSSRRLTWPALFILGIVGGILIGLSTGLPITGQVIAGSAPLSSVIPGRDPSTVSELANKFETANRRVTIAPKLAAPAQKISLPPRMVHTVPAAVSATPLAAAKKVRPKIVLVIDDLGLSEDAFRQINSLPGPLTLAFLPYGKDAQSMINAMNPEHQAIMHMPMEPKTDLSSAGPDMLRVRSDAVTLRANIRVNLNKLTGVVGVNNHTGSRFTENRRAMAVTLEELEKRDLFFLDSVTTKARVAKSLVGATGARVRERDVFLDGEWPNVSVSSVKQQLAELENIAEKHGVAIGIGHPYPDTIETIGPWLVTVEARGYDLVLLSDVMPPSRRRTALARLR